MEKISKTETRCQRCRAAFIPNVDEAERPDPSDPRYCVGCYAGISDPMRFHNFAAVRTNESHDPNAWTWEP